MRTGAGPSVSRSSLVSSFCPARDLIGKKKEEHQLMSRRFSNGRRAKTCRAYTGRSEIKEYSTVSVRREAKRPSSLGPATWYGTTSAFGKYFLFRVRVIGERRSKSTGTDTLRKQRTFPSTLASAVAKAHHILPLPLLPSPRGISISVGYPLTASS